MVSTGDRYLNCSSPDCKRKVCRTSVCLPIKAKIIPDVCSTTYAASKGSMCHIVGGSATRHVRRMQQCENVCVTNCDL